MRVGAEEYISRGRRPAPDVSAAHKSRLGAVHCFPWLTLPLSLARSLARSLISHPCLPLLRRYVVKCLMQPIEVTGRQRGRPWCPWQLAPCSRCRGAAAHCCRTQPGPASSHMLGAGVPWPARHRLPIQVRVPGRCVARSSAILAQQATPKVQLASRVPAPPPAHAPPHQPHRPTASATPCSPPGVHREQALIDDAKQRLEAR